MIAVTTRLFFVFLFWGEWVRCCSKGFLHTANKNALVPRGGRRKRMTQPAWLTVEQINLDSSLVIRVLFAKLKINHERLTLD